MIKSERIGEVSYTKYGTEAKIISYNHRNDIYIEFQDQYKYVIHTTYSRFKNGNIINPYDKTLYNIGFLGVGKYHAKIDGRNTKEYYAWANMMERCYNNFSRKKCHMSYIGCTVCEWWHNFQNFAEWYNKNFYDIKGEIMNVDKDILVKGNKIYCPENCCIVPQSINSFFTKSNATRGNFPIGVSYNSERNKYSATCTNHYSNITKHYFKRFDCKDEAFMAYKSFKEKCVKEMAEYYKKYLPINVFKALVTYKVEITD